MFTRMIVCRTDREIAPNEPAFALLLVHHGIGGSVSHEVVCYHDTYALCDYWATMYNIGSKQASLDQIKQALAKGFEGLPPDGRQEYMERRYGGLSPEAGGIVEVTEGPTNGG